VVSSMISEEISLGFWTLPDSRTTQHCHSSIYWPPYCKWSAGRTRERDSCHGTA